MGKMLCLQEKTLISLIINLKTTIMKKIVLSIVIIMAISSAKAQFSHNTGATLFMVKAEGGDNVSPYGVTYFPRYSFGAISVGIPLTIGISGSYNSQQGASTGSSFTYQLPLVVDYNVGLGADPEPDGSFGFYGGVGYSLFSTSYIGTFDYGTLKASGPMLRAGIRLNIKDKMVSIGGSYLKGGGDSKASVIGISALIQL